VKQRFRDVRFGDQGKLWHILVLSIVSVVVWVIAALAINTTL